MNPKPLAALAILGPLSASAAVLTGPAARGDWTSDAPGVTRKITLDSLPSDVAAKIGVAPPAIVPRPATAQLRVPPGFTVAEFARLRAPRQIRAAPNGDVFAAETDAGRLKILRTADGAAKPVDVETYAEGLDRPFGVGFWPPGPNPQWLYVANANSVVRFAYRNGDLKARGQAEVIVPRLAADTRDHSTRDIAFTPDGRTMLISVGSGSNDAEDMPRKTPTAAREWEGAHATGSAWGREEDRADILAFDPLGHGRRVWATGLRNCVTLTFQPSAATPWCAVNERDLMGDNLPPDYVTRVREHDFYGWPWFYLGAHQDPHHAGERPDLASKVVAPDVLIQSHSAALGLTFYAARRGAAAFPADYHGEAFAGLHGSWNRARRTGYKVVRILMKDGQPTGAYQDFLTGFVVDAKERLGPAGRRRRGPRRGRPARRRRRRRRHLARGLSERSEKMSAIMHTKRAVGPGRSPPPLGEGDPEGGVGGGLGGRSACARLRPLPALLGRAPPRGGEKVWPPPARGEGAWGRAGIAPRPPLRGADALSRRRRGGRQVGGRGPLHHVPVAGGRRVDRPWPAYSGARRRRRRATPIRWRRCKKSGPPHLECKDPGPLPGWPQRPRPGHGHVCGAVSDPKQRADIIAYLATLKP